MPAIKSQTAICMQMAVWLFSEHEQKTAYQFRYSTTSFGRLAASVNSLLANSRER